VTVVPALHWFVHGGHAAQKVTVKPNAEAMQER
jgi:hypothetical protein